MMTIDDVNVGTKKNPTTDSERLTALEDAYLVQTEECLAKNKWRGVASMTRICEVAGVDTTYVYGHKNPSSEDAKKYKDFVKKVNNFKVRFNKRNSENSDDIAAQADIIKQSLEENHVLLAEILTLQNTVKSMREKQTNYLADIAQLEARLASPTNETNRMSLMNDSTIISISPDKGILHNGRYDWTNKGVRDKAWRDARRDFANLMKRKVPQRVYLLMGMPCSGKSEWAELKLVSRERHSVIIDATNLKSGDRASWIQQARKARDVKICVVRFFTDFTTIKMRNAAPERSHKKIDVDILEQKRNSIEEVNPEFEDIDEMLFVQEDD